MSNGREFFSHPKSHHSGKSWIFCWGISRTWKVLENHFGPGKYCVVCVLLGVEAEDSKQNGADEEEDDDDGVEDGEETTRLVG